MVDGDRLIKTPWQELSAVEQFLGLPPEISASNFYFNQTKGFYCLREASGEEHCLGGKKGRTHPKVDPGTVSLLRRFYAKHNHKFYDMVGKDFGWPEEGGSYNKKWRGKVGRQGSEGLGSNNP